MSGHQLVWRIDGAAACTCGQWGEPADGDPAEGFDRHAVDAMTDECDPTEETL